MSGFRVETLRVVGSTNDVVAERARAGEPAGLVLRAERQEAGRGRQGRAWASPPGNLYASLLLRPRQPIEHMASLSLVAALSLADAIATLPNAAHLALRLKWPNDVLVANAKLAGILSEGLVQGAQSTVIVGLGVNLRSSPEGLPYPTTSLAAQAVEIAPQTLLEAFLAHFAGDYATWQADGFAPLRARWLARAHGLGQEVESRAGGPSMSGRFVDLDPRGRLLLETAGGTRAVSAGELFFRTPEDLPC